MKLIKSVVALTFAFALVASPSAFAQDKPKDKTCCEKAKADGKECTHKCCVAAHKDGKSCEKCNPNKEDVKKEKKNAK
jgi:hypothetical protein